LTINENADPTVRKDFESYFNRAVPESRHDYIHDDEGPDDMPAHLKSLLTRQLRYDPYHQWEVGTRNMAGNLFMRTQKLRWRKSHRCYRVGGINFLFSSEHAPRIMLLLAIF
jgi:hypothetical protein